MYCVKCNRVRIADGCCCLRGRVRGWRWLDWLLQAKQYEVLCLEWMRSRECKETVPNMRHDTGLQVRSVLPKFLRCCFTPHGLVRLAPPPQSLPCSPRSCPRSNLSLAFVPSSQVVDRIDRKEYGKTNDKPSVISHHFSCVNSFFWNHECRSFLNAKPTDFPDISWMEG